MAVKFVMNNEISIIQRIRDHLSEQYKFEYIAGIKLVSAPY